MFKEETLDAMSNDDKIEKAEALNTIHEAYQEKYNETIKEINRKTAVANDVIEHAIAAKQKIMNTDLEFQEKQQNIMINSIRKMDALQKEINSPSPSKTTEVAESTATSDSTDDFVYF